MCFSISLSATAQQVANRYKATELPSFQGGNRISAFSHPKLPVVTAPGTIAVMHWGLVPHWVKDRDQADDIRKKTLNARAETLFAKPSFRDAAKHHRCLVPVTSFQEWHHNSDRSKTPYDISVKELPIFSLAGVWSEWKGPQSGRSFFSYSVITCDANPLMAEIHNSKQRMPVILPESIENRWLSEDLSKEELQELLVPFDERFMEAKDITRRY